MATDTHPPTAPRRVPPAGGATGFREPGPCFVDADGTRRWTALTYATRSGYRPCVLDLAVPATAAPAPVVVWVHGGGWAEGDRRYPPSTVPVGALFGGLLAAGLAVASVDYRHSLEAPHPAQLHDVKAALRYVRRFAGELGVDGDRIGLWGESAGGHLAALAAVTTGVAEHEGTEGVPGPGGPVRAVVDWYGIHDVGALLDAFDLSAVPADDPHAWPRPVLAFLGDGADTRGVARAASPITHAGAGAPPFLLVHGTGDRVVPYAQSETFAARLRALGVDVTLCPVPGADHILRGSPDVGGIIAESVTFLADRLGA